MNFDSFLSDLEDVKKSNKEYVICTLVDVIGSAPQNVGARMIVTRDGLFCGTIGGGKIEAHCLEFAKSLMKDKSAQKFVEWNLQKDIGMTCGGVVKIFFEVFSQRTKWRVNIFGAGHVSQALSRTLCSLECDLHVYDTRKEWLSKLEEVGPITTHLCESLAAKVNGLPDRSFNILMTMGHATDVPILESILKSNKKFPYVGVIGSKSKRNAMEKELASLGVEEFNFICPIGEDFGNNSPQEIAISICAQLLRYRDKLIQVS